MIHIKGMVGPCRVWKGEITSVCGCHADKLEETFEWRADRLMSHLERISYKEGFTESGLQIFHGRLCKKERRGRCLVSGRQNRKKNSEWNSLI